MSTINTYNQSLRDNSYYIKFYPKIKSTVGCEKATLILGRLEYWFERYTSGFYKFIEPCSHPLYREGDSWVEEIGFSRKVFTKAFDLIGVRYKSKSAFMQAADKFQGKLYASYHDRKTNQNYFVRNNEYASQFIKNLFKKEMRSNVPKINPKAIKKACNATPSLIKKDRSRNCQKGRSSGGIIGGKKSNSLQRNTSSLEITKPNVSSSSFEDAPEKVTDEMIKIWKEEIGELGISCPSSQFLSQLVAAFKNFFNQSLESWKAYCRLISSSKFLMGEAQNKFFKKAWITWAIRKEAIEKIKSGGFQLGDRETKGDAKIQEIDSEIKVLELKKQGIEETMDTVRQHVKKERVAQAREKIKNLPERHLEQFKEEFSRHLEEENNSLTQEFNRAGWKGLFVQTYFEAYLEEHIDSQLFEVSLEEEVNQRLNESGLLKKFTIVSEEITGLRAQRKLLTAEKY